MKLVNHLTLRLSAITILILFMWSVVYFLIQMKEIHDGIDEGLNNLKQEFIIKSNHSEGFIADMVKHDPINIIVEEITAGEAYAFQEKYSTTRVYFPSELEDEEVRMLKTAFQCDLDGKYYGLKIFTSTVESEDLIKNILYLLASFWIVLALTIIALNRIIIRKSNKPFKKLLYELEKFHLNEKSDMIEFQYTSIKEYKELNKSVEKLLNENIQAFTNQKNLIENTSHELQTPLASAINKLELILDNEDLTRKQAEEINATLQILNRMKKLNSSLLLLAKIKNNQFNDSEVNLVHVFEEVIDNLQSFIEYKEINLRIEKNSGISIFMNSDLAYILASNLVKNAIFHNIKGGNVIIHFEAHSIVITNDGKPLNGNKLIFDRYSSNGNNNQSSGLGLSIAKSIADRYNFAITYQYEEKHIITIFLP